MSAKIQEATIPIEESSYSAKPETLEALRIYSVCCRRFPVDIAVGYVSCELVFGMVERLYLFRVVPMNDFFINYSETSLYLFCGAAVKEK